TRARIHPLHDALPILAERTSSASTFSSRAARTLGSLIASLSSTSQPAWRNRARPSGWMPSQANTRICYSSRFAQNNGGPAATPAGAEADQASGPGQPGDRRNGGNEAREFHRPPRRRSAGGKRRRLRAREPRGRAESLSTAAREPAAGLLAGPAV